MKQNSFPFKNVLKKQSKLDLPYEILSPDHELTLKEKLENVLIKVVLVGESAVGKTSLIKRLINDKFENRYFPTLAIDYSNFRILVG